MNKVEAVKEKEFKESDEHGEKVVVVKGGVVGKVTKHRHESCAVRELKSGLANDSK